MHKKNHRENHTQREGTEQHTQGNKHNREGDKPTNIYYSSRTYNKFYTARMDTN